MKLALLSVYDKTGVTEFATKLAELGYMVLASGGTAKAIKKTFEELYGESKEKVNLDQLIEVSEFTGFPESPDGLVKTLHPKIHGGFLLNPDNKEHAKYMLKNGMYHIEVFAGNLYPFDKAIQKEGITPKEAAHMIDIGGPTMVRAAAKAALLYENVYVITDPADYENVISRLKSPISGFPKLDSATVRNLAKKAFAHTAEYEKNIDEFLNANKE